MADKTIDEQRNEDNDLARKMDNRDRVAGYFVGGFADDEYSLPPIKRPPPYEPHPFSVINLLLIWPDKNKEVIKEIIKKWKSTGEEFEQCFDKHIFPAAQQKFLKIYNSIDID